MKIKSLVIDIQNTYIYMIKLSCPWTVLTSMGELTYHKCSRFYKKMWSNVFKPCVFHICVHGWFPPSPSYWKPFCVGRSHSLVALLAALVEAGGASTRTSLPRPPWSRRAPWEHRRSSRHADRGAAKEHSQGPPQSRRAQERRRWRGLLRIGQERSDHRRRAPMKPPPLPRIPPGGSTLRTGPVLTSNSLLSSQHT